VSKKTGAAPPGVEFMVFESIQPLNQNAILLQPSLPSSPSKVARAISLSRFAVGAMGMPARIPLMKSRQK
jgi:hypothetical protein